MTAHPVTPDSSPPPRDAVGAHLLVDLHGVAPEWLTDEARLMSLLLGALRAAGFHVLGHVSHQFPGPHAGVTGMVLLSESHAAFHTYPEYEYLALDLFTCGAPDPDDVLDAMIRALRPTRLHTQRHPRGGNAVV